MTVFDPSAVLQLEADTQSRTFVRTLVDTYQRMLPPRVERITAAVAAADVDEALDAAHSLRVSSVMTGATELAGLASDLVSTLRSGDPAAAQEQALALPAASERALEALDAYFAEQQAAQESTDSIR